MRTVVSFLVIVVCGLLSCLVPSGAQEAVTAAASDPLTAAPGALDWWREARFGLFIHWGPVSLKGTEISWSRGGERRGRPDRGSQVPVEVYDNLYREFNPTQFNARHWVQLARDAGMKYIVFTTKHHDGFCMFDSKLTDYDIMSSPFGRDICRELADACHEAGMRLGWYYSPPDWHHPDYRTENHARYIEYLHGQLRELCSNYGQVDIIWFDGLGGSAADWDSERLFAEIRALQPKVIINNRGGLRGDFDTPEQHIGTFQRTRPWESCITLCRQWSWKPNDTLKSLQQCVQTLVRCAGGDGNLLLNVGPMPTGEIEPRQADRLREIGAWLGKWGNTIYGTRGGPFRPTPDYAATCKGERIWLHILRWPTDTLTLPSLGRKILSCSVLTGGTAEVVQTEDAVQVRVPSEGRDPIDTIVELVLDGPAFDAPVGKLVSGSVLFGKPAQASNVFQKSLAYGPEKALDDDPDTRWATDWGTHEAWLQVDAGAEVTVGRARISEACGQRVQQYELQVQRGDQWETFYRGKTLAPDEEVQFTPVTGRVFRLNILKATEGPTIWEFQLLPPAP
jgi:alpha-L-fucosidase